MRECHVEMAAHVFEHVVVRDHPDNVAAQLAQLAAEQQLVKAVRRLADEDRHALTPAVDGQLPGQVETLAQGAERLTHRGLLKPKPREIPTQAHEKEPILSLCSLCVLVCIEDVAIVTKHEIGERCDEPGAVAATDEKSGRGGIAHATHFAPTRVHQSSENATFALGRVGSSMNLLAIAHD